MLSEADYVTRIQKVLEKYQAPVDLSDDCAYLRENTALITTDALVEGVHFDLERDSLEQIGAQAAVANLSDVASSGGLPGWLVWSVILPPNFPVESFEQICEGFVKTAAQCGAKVVGGNLTVKKMPLTLAVTAGGDLAGKAPLLRSQAKEGDDLYVSGLVGDAGLIFTCPNAKDFDELLLARHAWRPHFKEAALLTQTKGCHAAMDISDGLCLDASRMAKASGLVVEIDSSLIPTSELYKKHLSTPIPAMTGGEDYVLLFASNEKPPFNAYRVGKFRKPMSTESAGTLLVDGEKPTFSLGYDYFTYNAVKS